MSMQGKKVRTSPSFIGVLFFSVMLALVLLSTRSAKGLPLTVNDRIEPSITIPPATTMYSLVQCADFQIVGVLKKVCSQPGSEVPGDEQDKKAFEDHFNLMMAFSEKEDLPFTSWLTVSRSESSPKVFMELSDGYGVYAVGEGETFADAMSNLMTDFFLYEHEGEAESDLSVGGANKKAFEV